jgi:hypothetical protein
MATALMTPHAHGATTSLTQSSTKARAAKHSEVKTFFSDLAEDLMQRPLQPAAMAKHEMFREHINAMTICYFSLILLLIAASLPILAYAVAY